MKRLKFSDLSEIHKQACHDPEHKLEDSYAAEVQRLQHIQGNRDLTYAQYKELALHPFKWEESMIRSLSPGVCASICKECFGIEPE